MNNHYKAPDGYRYEKDCITTDELWLGIKDSIENWTLITEEEARWIEESERAEHSEEAVID